MNTLTRLAATIFDQPLMIECEKLRTILHVLGPRIGLGGDGQGALPFELFDEDKPRTERRRRGFEKHGSVAVIDLSGTLVNRSMGINALSGIESYEQLREDLQDAGTDPMVRGVLLRMDTGGGDAAGVFDAADDVRAVAALKPVWAVTDDAALSAGYLLASQANRIIVSRTGKLGSIGVEARHVDETEKDRKEGRKVIEISSGNRKNELTTHSPPSKQALGAVQAEVDRLAEMFFEAVARGRDLSLESIRDQQAAVFHGPAAVEAGLADDIGNFESALRDLEASVNGTTSTAISVAAATPAVADTTNKEVTRMAEQNQPTAAPAAGTIESPPDEAAISAAVAKATTEAEAKGYRSAQQVMSLCQLAGMPDLAVSMISEALTPEQAAAKLLEAKAKLSAEGGEVDSKTLPGAGTAVTAESDLVIKACQALADQTKQRMGVR